MAREHRQKACLFVANAIFGKILPPKPWTIWITRSGRKEFDEDNLAGALKSVRDGVADALGLVNDRESPELCWRYGQAKGEYVVEVELIGKVPIA
jgi:hypothetical protein